MARDFGYPRSRHEWWREAKREYKEHLEDLDIGLRSMPEADWNSASKIHFDQYLLLRAYSSTSDIDKFRLEEFTGTEHYRAAKELVRSHQSFRDYLSVMSSRFQNARNTRAQVSMGVFGLVLYQQDQIARLKSEESNDGNPKVTMTPRYATRAYMRGKDQDSPTNRPKMLRNSDRVKQRPEANADTDDGEASPGASGLKEALKGLTLRGSDIVTPVRSTNLEASPGIAMPDSNRSALSHSSQLSASLIQAASDEQIVNAALVSFLQAITMPCTDTVEWAMDRNVLKMSDLYQARTDGCLFSQALASPLAILETKAHVRKSAELQITMQETAQMAAWIKSQPEIGVLPVSSDRALKRRILISQDNREIYLTIAEYSNAYDEYLKYTSDVGRELFLNPSAKAPYQFDRSTKGPFLDMRRYGPFDIKDPQHVEVVATAVVAFTTMLERSLERMPGLATGSHT